MAWIMKSPPHHNSEGKNPVTVSTSGQSNLTQGRIAAAYGRIWQVTPMCIQLIGPTTRPRNRIMIRPSVFAEHPVFIAMLVLGTKTFYC